MIDRGLLEQSASLDEMRAILEHFASDEKTFPNDVVHRRRGLSKDLIEEYEPLYRLSLELNAFNTGRLTSQSFAGADAIVEMIDGSQIAIQITTAGETRSTGLQREFLSQGEPVFPNQTASRNALTKRIESGGRILSTRLKNTEQMIAEVKAALQRKILSYRPDTQYLLIRIRQSSKTMDESWKYRLQNALASESILPYKAVFVANSDCCVRADT